MSHISGAAAYLPNWRLDRRAIGGRGTRSIASFDEDATSMGVEAARRLDPASIAEVDSVLFVSTSPPYADRTNATAILRALDLPSTVGAYDMTGSVRSVVAAWRAASDAADAGRTTLVVAGEVRIGLPGSADERNCGDGAAAMVFSPVDEGNAEILGHGTASAEFLDRWRIPGATTSSVWEERFGETEYLPAAEAAFTDALKVANVAAGDVDRLIVTGLHARAVAGARKATGVRPDAFVDDLAGSVGTTGAAHPLLLLAHTLQEAEPRQIVALLVLSDGADCMILRAGSAGASVGLELNGASVSYHDSLVWRGLLQREGPRRPDPDRPAAPPSGRNVEWKFGLVGSRCLECGTRHLPPERVCLGCRSHDRMTREPLANVQGTITTFAVDHLAFSVAPPVVAAVVDLDGGGRIQCELTDVDPNAVAIGDRVQMTFRRLYTTADGVHNYFWKARPIEEGR